MQQIRQWWVLLTLLGAAWLLGGCSAPGGAAPPVLATPTRTVTPAPTGTPTTTPVWFPPTATLTPFPIQVLTPTQDLSPQAGEVLFQDIFDQPEQWSLGRTSTTSIAITDNELTLALSQPEGYLYSLRAGTVLSNFYLEITASAGLCRDGDEYGLLLRVSKGLEFYRFGLTCDGQRRLDKYYAGRASSPQALAPSGEVPRGAPGEARLGVWARGKELRFYINGQYQFTLQDASLLSGGFGVFARSAGENAVTIRFSDLVVRKVEP